MDDKLDDDEECVYDDLEELVDAVEINGEIGLIILEEHKEEQKEEVNEI